jgi:hypothetical protein
VGPRLRHGEIARVVCSLDVPALATSVELLDETGAVLDTQLLTDPRTRLRQVLPQNRES